LPNTLLAYDNESGRVPGGAAGSQGRVLNHMPGHGRDERPLAGRGPSGVLVGWE